MYKDNFDFRTVKARDARAAIKEFLLRDGGAQAYITIGGLQRMLHHHPAMHAPATKLPWPFSVFQMHDIGLVYSNDKGVSEDKPPKRFTKDQIDIAISEFLSGSSAEEKVSLSSGF